MPAPPLASADELAAALEGPQPPVVLDARWRLSGPPAREDYLAGHLPGAVFVDVDTDLADPMRPDRRGGRHPLPDPARFGAAMRRAGVRRDRPVVVYDERDGTTAARAWWLLVHHGHDDVRLLDGGLTAWRAARCPTPSGAVEPTPGDWEPTTPGRLAMLDADGAAEIARSGALLDARTPPRYRGETEPVDPVAGHVPGARSAPAAGWVDDDGRLLDPDGVRERLAALGVAGNTPVAVYCGSGVNATQTVLALATAGIDAALYAGSWSDWVSDPARAVATGETA